jgi:hypothetical protein
VSPGGCRRPCSLHHTSHPPQRRSGSDRSIAFHSVAGQTRHGTAQGERTGRLLQLVKVFHPVHTQTHTLTPEYKESHTGFPAAAHQTLLTGTPLAELIVDWSTMHLPSEQAQLQTGVDWSTVHPMQAPTLGRSAAPLSVDWSSSWRLACGATLRCRLQAAYGAPTAQHGCGLPSIGRGHSSGGLAPK